MGTSTLGSQICRDPRQFIPADPPSACKVQGYTPLPPNQKVANPIPVRMARRGERERGGGGKQEDPTPQTGCHMFN